MSAVADRETVLVVRRSGLRFNDRFEFSLNHNGHVFADTDYPDFDTAETAGLKAAADRGWPVDRVERDEYR